MKNIFKLFIVCLLFTACEETEPVLFDAVGGQTLATFNVTSSKLPVIIDDIGEVEVQVNVTTVSNVDRTVSISVDEEASTANPENYSVPNSVVIPAGQHLNTFTISGIDNSVEVDPETIVLNIDSIDTGIVNGVQHTVSLFQSCPVPVTYMVGDYVIVDSNGNLSSDEVVNLTIPVDDDGEIIDGTVRIFTTTFLPGSTVERPTTITLNLVCGSFAIGEVDESLTCTQDNPFALDSAGDDNSTFSSSYDDDNVGDVHTVNYIEDSYADCGASSLQNFTLTKQ
nr:hypothetical protein [uncultured Psychroserpens sp.]